MAAILGFFIKIYQKKIRIFLPRACRFYPSCSQYALDSLNKHGLFGGSIKTIVRIAKCSPFFKGGYDPA